MLAADPYTILLQVLLIDLVLAGDNAVVIGLAAAGLPDTQRTRAVLFGIAAATALRLLFALVATQLLQIVGLVLAGGILLLWVSWKMLRELRTPREARHDATEALADFDYNADGVIAGRNGRKTFAQAAGQIVLADVSMSLDNVLAVAGAARDHLAILVVGLAISIALMGVAASYIALILHKHRWVAYLGLAMIVYVAFDMIGHGAGEVWPLLHAAIIN
jgi:YjbE family integral membrane protein